MNGNCPGIIGGRALLRSIRIKALAKKTLVVNLDKANLNYLDDTFDRANPSGDHEYNMDNPYGYAVVCILFEMASTKPDARFLHVTHGLPVVKQAGAGRGDKDLDSDSDSDDGDSKQKMKWTKVNLGRGPSENDKANDMWKHLIEGMYYFTLHYNITTLHHYFITSLHYIWIRLVINCILLTTMFVIFMCQQIWL